MAILLKRWILPIGGASAVEGLRSTGLPRLVPDQAVLSRCGGPQEQYQEEEAHDGPQLLALAAGQA